METVEICYARMPDGSQLAYEVVGAGSHDLLLVPSFLVHLELNWEIPGRSWLLRRLSRWARVIVFDRLGTGLSDARVEGAGLAARVEELDVVLNAAGVESAHVFGAGDGSPIALGYAAASQERVKSVAIDRGYAANPMRFAASSSSAEVETLTASFVEWVESSWGSGGFARQVFGGIEDALGLYGRLERNAATPRGAGSLLAESMSFDVRPLLGDISVPVLVGHFRADRSVPLEAAEEIVELVEKAELKVFEGSGHGSFGTADSDPFMDAYEEFVTGRPAASPIERRLATILFTDIVSSTSTAVSRGDARWARDLAEHDQICRALIARGGGQVIKQTGDGFLALFGSPAAALEVADRIGPAVERIGLVVRAGVHVGEIEITDDDVTGVAVVIASRIADSAAGGEVRTSRTVVDLVAGSPIEFDEIGGAELRGLPGTWQLYSARSSGA